MQAQTLAALSAGARVLRSPVWALRDAADGTRTILDDGSEITAGRVLVCAGAFAAPVGLIAGLPMWTEGRCVVLARVSDDLVSRLRDLPCLMLEAPDEELTDLYLMPPLRYPDGHHYVKIGTGCIRRPLDALDELQQWFRLPPPQDDVARLSRALTSLLPDLAAAEMRSTACAVTMTASELPIVTWTHADRIAFAGGGNGKAAKSSDEIGRLGAALITGTATGAELAAFTP